jgi:pre-mRNA-splicing helicase BRR2
VTICECPAQNSSLVLTSENRTRDAHEPSGEPETLWGRMKGKMGDKALRAKPEGADERKQKLQKKREANREDDLAVPSKVRKAGNMNSVMDLDTAGA